MKTYYILSIGGYSPDSGSEWFDAPYDSEKEALAAIRKNGTEGVNYSVALVTVSGITVKARSNNDLFVAGKLRK